MQQHTGSTNTIHANKNTPLPTTKHPPYTHMHADTTHPVCQVCVPGASQHQGLGEDGWQRAVVLLLMAVQALLGLVGWRRRKKESVSQRSRTWHPQRPPTLVSALRAPVQNWKGLSPIRGTPAWP